MILFFGGGGGEGIVTKYVYTSGWTNLLAEHIKNTNYISAFGCEMILLQQGKVKCKGTAIPLQAWTGPEVSRRLRLPDFKTVKT